MPALKNFAPGKCWPEAEWCGEKEPPVFRVDVGEPGLALKQKLSLEVLWDKRDEEGCRQGQISSVSSLGQYRKDVT